MAPKPLSKYLWIVNPDTGCWEWQRGRNGGGYGTLRFKGKHTPAHRVMYQCQIGPIPNGYCVCHSCDNPRCVNPEHLWVGTHKDNNDDKMAKGRGGKAGAISPPRGSSHYASGLSEDDVREIRSLYKKMKQVDIAKKFNVNRMCIWHIVHQKTWRHI